MGSRASLNKVLLIGNLTRDPELRYTPSGAAVCSFGLATNRTYVSSDGTKKEETEFIKIVSWNKLAELCSQLLRKGRKVYVDGRMQTRSWETPDGQQRQTTEVVIDDMRILDSRRDFEQSSEGDLGEAVLLKQPEVKKTKDENTNEDDKEIAKKSKSQKTEKLEKEKIPEDVSGKVADSDIDLEDLPF